MTISADGDGVTRILGVYVREYKNLSDVWLSWHDGIALYGANGAGKTTCSRRSRSCWGPTGPWT